MNTPHKNMEELASTGIRSLWLKYFFPAFTGVVLNMLYNVVDRIFIGQGVGALAFSGLSAVFPIMLIMMATGMLIGIGSGVRISLHMGKNELEMAGKVLGNAIVMLLLMSLVITLGGFAIKEPILRLFGIGPETYGYANDYLDIILFGAVFNMVGFSLNNIIRSEGSARTAMISMFISAGMNIILDYIFIFKFNMGVKGAAWATIISQMALTVWVVKHFLGRRAVVKLHFRNLRIEAPIVWHIISVGFAPFTIQMAASVVQGTFNTQLTTYGGDIAVGAMGVINSYVMIIFMSIIAINMAAQPIIGFNHGAGVHSRVKETLMLSFKVATAISIVGFLLAESFPDVIVKLFNTDHPELLDIGVSGLRIFASAQVIVGFQIIIISYLQAIGRAGAAAFLSLLRQVMILIPMLIIMPRFWGLDGVWISAPFSDIASAIICAAVVIRELRAINASIKHEQELISA